MRMFTHENGRQWSNFTVNYNIKNVIMKKNQDSTAEQIGICGVG